jgi:hypothetical protein
MDTPGPATLPCLASSNPGQHGEHGQKVSDGGFLDVDGRVFDGYIASPTGRYGTMSERRLLVAHLDRGLRGTDSSDIRFPISRQACRIAAVSNSHSSVPR